MCHINHLLYRRNDRYIPYMLALFIRSFCAGTIHWIIDCNRTYEFYCCCFCLIHALNLFCLIFESQFEIGFMARALSNILDFNTQKHILYQISYLVLLVSLDLCLYAMHIDCIVQM